MPIITPPDSDTLHYVREVAHVDDTYTYTTVILRGERYFGVGAAKRNPADEYDAQTGYALAVARALRDLAAKIEAGAGS